MNNTIFYRCPTCGNIVIKLVDSGVVPSCCGHTMLALSATDADEPPSASQSYTEKHIPQLSWVAVGNTTKNSCFDYYDNAILRVEVGSHPHPMTPDHYIQFVCLVCDRGIQVRRFSPGDRPCASFVLPTATPTNPWDTSIVRSPSMPTATSTGYFLPCRRGRLSVSLTGKIEDKPRSATLHYKKRR